MVNTFQEPPRRRQRPPSVNPTVLLMQHRDKPRAAGVSPYCHNTINPHYPMKPLHIFSRIPGEQDAQVAVIRIEADDITRITAMRAAVVAHTATHGGYACMRQSHTFDITFLKDVPEGIPVLAGELCSDDIMDDSIAVHDLDPDRLERLADEQELHVRSECEGILLNADHAYITGHEKHDNELLESLDILPLLPLHEVSGFQTPLPPLDALRLIAAAASVDLANGNSEPDVMATSLEGAHNALAEIQGLVRRALIPATA